MIAMRRLLIVALCLIAPVASAQEIVTLATRPNATQSYLLLAPKEPPHAAAILFPGAGGDIRLRAEDGEIRFAPNNFLVRSRALFASRGVAVAVFDAPSDQSGGMEDDFRLGAAHAEDIGKVVAEIRKRFPGTPVFLVGTSRGTISAASAGNRLANEVNGVVLTATLFLAAGPRPGLSRFDFATIPTPLLLVHHVRDGCTYTPYSSAKRLGERFPLVSVSGGLPPKSKPCDAMSEHGFLGKEEEAVEAIVNWMLKKPYRSEIN
jgi:pimeloyl-ACP methyl ester carboxylesterase